MQLKQSAVLWPGILLAFGSAILLRRRSAPAMKAVKKVGTSRKRVENRLGR